MLVFPLCPFLDSRVLHLLCKSIDASGTLVSTARAVDPRLNDRKMLNFSLTLTSGPNNDECCRYKGIVIEYIIYIIGSSLQWSHLN